MQQIADWLQKLALGQYAHRFAENDITFAILPHLTDQDLKELGVASLGHRRQLLLAIAELNGIEKGTTELSPAAAALVARHDVAERRQVTVMFSDLVGSTALSARMDPEDLREIISAYQNCVAHTVGSFGGFVAKYMGDGVLVYFGYPKAHEDDAERAVRAGLELVAAVGDLKSHVALQTRVGIATGLVVVGDLIGSGSSQEQAIVGETPNLAARLQGIAEPSRVVIAESTRKLVGNLFELEDLGAKDLKGVEGPVRAWAALRPSSMESRFEALHASGVTELVGREEELELLLRRWSKAKTGEGQVVLLSGEPGIGKSRLTAALLERIASEPHTRLRYFCSPQHTDSALYPIISQMERAAGFAHDDTAHAKLDKLDALLAQSFTPRQDAAVLAEMLSLPNDGRYAAIELNAQQRRQKTLEALTAQLEALSRSNPVLMIFEDVHWLDPTSLEVLGRSVDRLKTLGVLLIITYRPEFEPPWIGRPYVTALTLNRLGEREIAAIIDRVTGNTPLPASIRLDIIERTDGIPLFVEEMTKAVLEAESEGQSRQTASAVPSSALAVPASLHASLMARLDRLGPAKEVAQIAAAIGRQFSHALLGPVAGKPEAELASALDRLIAAGLLFRQGVPPHATYLFKHALVQDVAYGTLLRDPRRALHARVAATLETNFPEIVVAQPALLAQHCAEGGLVEKAVVYWLKAGQQSLGRSATTEAVAQLHKGLDLLAGLPDSPWLRQQQLNLHIALRPALAATKGYSAADVGDTITRARALAEQLDQPEYLVRLGLGQWAFHLHRSEFKQALSLAEQIEKIGEARNDVTVQLRGRRASGYTRLFLGEFVAARELLEQCHGLGDPAHRALRGRLSDDPYATMLAYLAVILAYLGYSDQARLRLNEALSEARRLSHAQTLAVVLASANWMESITRSPEMYRHAEELLALSSEHQFPLYLGWATGFRGWSLTALGQAEEGLTLITRGLATIRGTGSVVGTLLLVIACAETYVQLGRLVEASNCLAEAAHMIETTEERFCEAELHRLRGELNATSDQAAAEQSYRRAIIVSERQDAKALELRAATSLARLWRDQGKVRQALEVLGPVYGWFTEGFDTRDPREARALLGALAS